MCHGPVFQHGQVETTTVITDESGLQAFKIIKETLQQLFFIETGFTPGSQFTQMIGLAGTHSARALDFSLQEADRNDFVKGLAGKRVFAAGDIKVIAFQLFASGLDVRIVEAGKVGNGVGIGNGLDIENKQVLMLHRFPT